MNFPPDSISRYGSLVSEPQAFFESCARPLSVTGWYNPSKKAVSPLIGTAPDRTTLNWDSNGFKCADMLNERFLMDFLTGAIAIQEESAMTSVHLMDIQPGQRILDLCAAPGNKTAQISTRLGESGTLVANDISKARLGVLHGVIDRMGLANVVTTTYDARQFPIPHRLFDSVLADVPCSCEGTSRKYPGILLKNNQNERTRLVRNQIEILERAVRCVRPGGCVVYSTCTYAPEENECVVNDVLKRAPSGFECELVQVQIPGFHFSPGLTNWNGEHLDDSLSKCARIWPHLNDTGGFFLAILRRCQRDDDVSKDAPKIKTEPILTSEWPWLAHDFSESDLSPWRSIAFSNKYDRLVGQECEPPEGLKIQTIGMTGLNLKSQYPKFSTALALKIGHLARGAWAEIEPERALDYWDRKTVPVLTSQTPYPSTRTMIVRCGGQSLGLGSASDTSLNVQSRFPKVWGGLQIADRIRQIRTL